MGSRLIVKVKCGETLRRFSAHSDKNGILDLDLAELRKKIQFLFQFAPDADLILRYIDEDNDEITLVDDNDLYEAAKQHLNPLRIIVTLNSTKETGSSLSVLTPPKRSIQVQHLSPPMNFTRTGPLESTQNDVLPKLCFELAGNIASLVMNNLAEWLSKLELPNRDSACQDNSGANSSSKNHASGSLTKCRSSEDMEFLEVNPSRSPLSEFTKGVDNGCKIKSVKGPGVPSLSDVSDSIWTSHTDFVNTGNAQICGEKCKYEQILDVPSSQALSPEKFNCSFVCDLSIGDTVVAPNVMFAKQWRLRNSGTRAWPHRSKLVCLGGNQLTAKDSVEVEIPSQGLPVGKDVDVSVDLKSPEMPGQYISYWKMSLPSGETFGQRIWILVEVREPSKNSKAFDLNHPPPSPESERESDDEENISSDGECYEADCLKMINEGENLLPPTVTGEINPENIECGVTQAPHVQDISAAISKDDIDIITGNENNDLVPALVEVLRQMGFKSTSLNKEILRLNSYDLQKTVADLCGISDSDESLSELESMGYGDKERDVKSDMVGWEKMREFVDKLVAW